MLIIEEPMVAGHGAGGWRRKQRRLTRKKESMRRERERRRKGVELGGPYEVYEGESGSPPFELRQDAKWISRWRARELTSSISNFFLETANHPFCFAFSLSQLCFTL
jgi:hypothetical protein